MRMACEAWFDSQAPLNAALIGEITLTLTMRSGVIRRDSEPGIDLITQRPARLPCA